MEVLFRDFGGSKLRLLRGGRRIGVLLAAGHLVQAAVVPQKHRGVPVLLEGTSVVEDDADEKKVPLPPQKLQIFHPKLWGPDQVPAADGRKRKSEPAVEAVSPKGLMVSTKRLIVIELI